MTTTAPAPTVNEPAPTALSHRQVLVVFSGLMLGMLLAALDQTIVSTALPRIVSDLGGGDHLSWVVSAYLITSTVSTLLYGKISDLYGRKKVFQFAIVLFLIGSALCGLSQNMIELVGFRALQGLGGGGLISLAMAIIGDIVSPRERGRYQGYFGAVFGLSSVAGPLLGGFLSDGPGWRWVFYVNLPLGAIALVVIAIVLKLPLNRRHHAIDWWGAALMSGGTSCLLLVSVWGGTSYAWGSPVIIGTTLVGLALLALFVRVELRHEEPILPLNLFKIDVFRASVASLFCIGAALFGATIYLPLYLQTAHGVSATLSGLELLPLMAGLLTSSIISGRLISKLGRYKVFPVVGTFVMTLGLLGLTQLHTHTAWIELGTFMLITGLGLGACMQTLTLAVQNAVEYKDLGVATASTNFFRSLGGAFGVSIFGAILTNRLTHNLHKLPIPAGAHVGGSQGISVTAVALIPEPLRGLVLNAFSSALDVVFWVAVPVGAIAFLFTLRLREIRLGDKSGLERVTPEHIAEPAI